MADKHPKAEFKTNIPQDVKLVKNFWKGENQYGPSWAYEIEIEGKPFTWFVGENIQAKLDGIPMNTVIRVVKAEKRSEKDPTKTYHEYEITIPLFDVKGKATPEPPPVPPNPVDDLEVMDAVRQERKHLLFTALVDAGEVVALYNQGQESDSLKMDHQDIQKLAVTLLIDFNKRYSR